MGVWRYFLRVFFFFVFCGPALGQTFSSGERRTILMELYSSEGCSSCPPAEKQISQLVSHQDLWKKYVPLNFHVDYWNYLGWVDPYSNKKFTRRQNQYASLWRVGTIYTPAFVNNGKSMGASIDLNDSGVPSTGKLPRLKVVANGLSQFQVQIENLPGKTSDFEFHLALLGNGLVSKVNAGENRGRTLEQNFAVLALKSTSINQKNFTVRLAPLKSKAKPKSYSLAGWVTRKGELISLQAVGGPLQSGKKGAPEFAFSW